MVDEVARRGDAYLAEQLALLDAADRQTIAESVPALTRLLAARP